MGDEERVRNGSNAQVARENPRERRRDRNFHGNEREVPTVQRNRGRNYSSGRMTIDISFPIEKKLDIKYITEEEKPMEGMSLPRYGIINEEEGRLEIEGREYYYLKASFYDNEKIKNIKIQIDLTELKEMGLDTKSIEFMFFITDRQGTVLYLPPQFDRNVLLWARSNGIENYQLRRDIIGKYKLTDYIQNREGNERDTAEQILEEARRGRTLLRETNVSPSLFRLLQCKSKNMTHVLNIFHAEGDYLFQFSINVSKISQELWEKYEKGIGKEMLTRTIEVEEDGMIAGSMGPTYIAFLNLIENFIKMKSKRKKGFSVQELLDEKDEAFYGFLNGEGMSQNQFRDEEVLEINDIDYYRKYKEEMIKDRLKSIISEMNEVEIEKKVIIQFIEKVKKMLLNAEEHEIEKISEEIKHKIRESIYDEEFLNLEEKKKIEEVDRILEDVFSDSGIREIMEEASNDRDIREETINITYQNSEMKVEITDREKIREEVKQILLGQTIGRIKTIELNNVYEGMDEQIKQELIKILKTSEKLGILRELKIPENRNEKLANNIQLPKSEELLIKIKLKIIGKELERLKEKTGKVDDRHEELIRRIEKEVSSIISVLKIENPKRVLVSTPGEVKEEIVDKISRIIEKNIENITKKELRQEIILLLGEIIDKEEIKAKKENYEKIEKLVEINPKSSMKILKSIKEEGFEKQMEVVDRAIKLSNMLKKEEKEKAIEMAIVMQECKETKEYIDNL